MKDLNNYIDKFGMVVTNQMDGGDSCAHGLAMHYGAAVLKVVLPPAIESLDEYCAKLEKGFGRYVRHPDPTMWYSETNRFSRDQLTPLLLALALTKRRKRLATLFLAHAAHLLLFAWNTRINASLPGTAAYAWKLPDITGPDIWAAYIRGFRFWPLYPILVVFDLMNVITAVQNRYWPQNTIQMNAVLMVDFAARVMPTPTALLARWIYGKEEPVKALNSNWGDVTLFNPPVNQYLVPMVEKWP